MYRECAANLSMVRVILGDSYFDDAIYDCEIIRYNPEKECIYLLTEETKLPVFSLDALYECKIHNENEILVCQGFIKERYISKLGNVVVFEIQNGFYKNPVN